VDISVLGKKIKVRLDGVLRLSPTVASLPAATLLAFTGATGRYTDIHTVRAARLTATGYAVPPPYSPKWDENGAAALSGDDLVLTPAVPSVAGSSWYGFAVPSGRLSASFTAQIGGGSGGDGMTFTLLDPGSPSTSLGASGGGLGYGGLDGVAVTLDTYQNLGEPSSNFVAVATGGTGDVLTYAATSTAIGPLRTGTHRVKVVVTPTSHLSVTVDGTQVIDVPVTLPENVIPGFTAATGGITDVHSVRNVAITY
jgi:hypothetical protein